MTDKIVLKHEFVEFIPEILAERTIYVSLKYSTAVHRCCCGCGLEVVTPLGPTGWRLIRHARTISLHPSIGNWSFPCQSHYWIRQNQVHWAPRWNRQQIESGRAYDLAAKQDFYDPGHTHEGDTSGTLEPARPDSVPSIWKRICSWFSR